MKLKNLCSFLFCFTILFSCLAKASQSGWPEKLFAPRTHAVSSAFSRAMWIKNIDPNYDSGNLPIAVHSPLVYQDMVFLGKNDGSLEAYELSNGRSIWKVKGLGTYHAGPGIFEDLVIYGTTDGRVYARQWASGELSYEIDLGSPVESAPTIFNGRAIFHLRNHKIVSLDAKTGKILWAYQRSVPFLNTLQGVSVPLVYENKIFVGMADGNIVALSLDDGTALWERKIVTSAKFVDVDMTPVVVNNSLVISGKSGPIHFLNPSNGQIIRTVESNCSRPPLHLNGFYYVGTQEGQLQKYDSDWQKKGELILSRGAITSMKLWNGKLVIGDTKGSLFLVNGEGMSLVESRELGHDFSALFGDFEVSGPYLLALSSRNRLYAFYWKGN